MLIPTFLVLLLAALPLLFGACETQTTRDPAPGASVEVMGAGKKVYELGELGRAADYTMSAEKVRKCAVAPPFEPKTGYEKLGVEVVIEGTTPREVPVNPFYAELRDADGERYSSTLAGCEPVLEPVRVTEGDSARGWITFDVPKSARNLKMTYSPVVIGGGREAVSFELGR